MGKKECQSMGRVDCSLTISVVGKGLLEGFYPLKYGGHVLIILRFFLRHKEHMRIREMRESALKRKRKERLQTENKGSISGQSTGDWITYSIIEEGSLLDQSKQTDPRKPDDDASIQVNKNGKSSCTSIKPNHENSVGFTKYNGVLIEEGVRIAVLLVACGIPLFNTRQKKARVVLTSSCFKAVQS